jgi:S-adenosylmethionine synthetase
MAGQGKMGCSTRSLSSSQRVPPETEGLHPKQWNYLTWEFQPSSDFASAVFFQHTRTSKKIADVRFAHQLIRRLAAVRQQGIMQGLYPDGNAQVAIAYGNNTPIAIANLVISTHHAPSLSLRDLRYQLIEYVMKPVIPDRWLSHQVMDRERDRLDSTVIVVNPPGAFLVGGPKADAGLTGRKIIVETV